MIQAVASSDAHYDQLGAYDNFSFLDQILEADEIWGKTKNLILWIKCHLF